MRELERDIAREKDNGQSYIIATKITRDYVIIGNM